MQEKTAFTIDYENAVHERLKNIIDSKRSENEAAVGRLKSLESSWNDLNKSLEQEIKAEFDLMVLEEQATERARSLLRKNCVPVKKNAFVIAGKVVDAESMVGLPGLLIKIVKNRCKEQEVLTESRTDPFGNFTGTISPDNLDDKNCGKKVLTFLVFSDPKTLVHSEDKPMQIKRGKVEHVTLAIPCGANISDRLEGGKAVRDSVEKDAEVVSLRLTNMREAHTAVNRLAAVSLEDLQILSEELSIDPPDLPSPDIPDSPLPEDEQDDEIPEEPDDTTCYPDREDFDIKISKTKKDEFSSEPNVEREVEVSTETKGVTLEDITGIGRAKAEKVREAGITDVKAFSEADEVKLREILGDMDISKMKKESISLLEQAREASRESKEE